jgi:hypothetical protein|tara:strand:- start:331 stop:474 length:144 start_codon:yes stop_codon:yes gene_type:complete
MNTGAFGQSGGLFKFYSENTKNSSLSTAIASTSQPFKHALDYFRYVL